MTLPDRVYHLAEAANWPAIQRDGLFSASALLTRAGVAGAERERLERAQRPALTPLPGGAAVRDQLPMPPAALARCLVGATPAEWYALVNARVFFWLDPDRLNRQRKACGSRPQVVMVIDAPRLVAAHADRVALTPINTGNARRKPAVRGPATFVPYTEWLKTGWESEGVGLKLPARKRSHTPVELTVRDAVPDVMEFVVASVPLPAGRMFDPSAT